jgi:hypothetical protein
MFNCWLSFVVVFRAGTMIPLFTLAFPFSNMSDYNSDVLPVFNFVNPPYPQEVGTALVNATLDTFDISNDGTWQEKSGWSFFDVMP